MELSEISIKNRTFYQSINEKYESIKKLCWHLVKKRKSVFCRLIDYFRNNRLNIWLVYHDKTMQYMYQISVKSYD